MSNDNVTSLFGIQGNKDSKPKSRTYEIHFFPMDTDEEGVIIPGDVIKIHGYLKFGPQFIAAVDGPEDTATVIFAASTPTVKYIKEVSETGEVQGTLSL